MGRRKKIVPLGRDTKFQKLRSLKCYREVYDRLCAGWGLTDLARFIQDERQEYTEISRNGLVQRLCEFRKQMPAGHLVQKRFPEVFDDAKAKVEAGIDEIYELEELYRLQMRRVQTDFQIEQRVKKLMPSMTAEIREARNILENLAKLKMDLGLSQRAPKNVDISVDVELDANMGEDLADRFSDPAVKTVLGDAESRRRVMGVVEKVLKLPGMASEVSEEAN